MRVYLVLFAAVLAGCVRFKATAAGDGAAAKGVPAEASDAKKASFTFETGRTPMSDLPLEKIANLRLPRNRSTPFRRRRPFNPFNRPSPRSPVRRPRSPKIRR